MRTALMTTATLLLAACGGVEQDEDTGEAFVAERAGEDTASRAAAEDAPGELSLTALDCGTIEVGDLSIFASDGSYDGMTDTFMDTCWVVEHPDGVLLWDLGLPAGLVAGGPMSEGPFTVSLDRTLEDQLAERGITPTYVAISHYHFDHTGQPEAAAGATWLVHEAELDAMKADPSADQGGTWPALMALPTEAFGGERDVFGDGRVRIVQTPGHTPGHTSLLVDLAEEGPVLLTGDLYHREQSRTEELVPVFNTSEPRTRESMDTFEALAEEAGARVIIQHEDADVADLIGRTLR